MLYKFLHAKFCYTATNTSCKVINYVVKVPYLNSFQFLPAYRADNESNYNELFVSAAELLTDATFVCGSNKFSEEFNLYGSKVREDVGKSRII